MSFNLRFVFTVLGGALSGARRMRIPKNGSSSHIGSPMAFQGLMADALCELIPLVPGVFPGAICELNPFGSWCVPGRYLRIKYFGFLRIFLLAGVSGAYPPAHTLQL